MNQITIIFGSSESNFKKRESYSPRPRNYSGPLFLFTSNCKTHNATSWIATHSNTAIGITQKVLVLESLVITLSKGPV